MRFQEYGTKQKNVILLLHGGGLSWWNYREVAEHLQKEYHVILPILDGHAGSDRPLQQSKKTRPRLLISSMNTFAGLYC